MSTWRKVLRGVCCAALIGALAAGAFFAGTQMDRVLNLAPSVAYAQEPAQATPTVEDREAVVNARTVGEVLINDEIVVRMRTSAGGFSAHERATVIADRLRRWLSQPHSPHDLAARRSPHGGAELRAAGVLIAHVNEAEAQAIGSTAMGLADAWRVNVMSALGVEAPAPAPVADPVAPVADDPEPVDEDDEPLVTEVEPDELEEIDPEPELPEGFSDRIVPIFSLGRGTRIGAARINGPREAVGRVQGVTQLETRFRDFLVIDIYVPVTTEGGLDRVQQVGLTAIGDLGI